MKKDCYYCKYQIKGECKQLLMRIDKPVRIVDCKHSRLDMEKVRENNSRY